MRPHTVGRFQDIEVRIHPSIVLVVAWAVYHWGYGAGGGIGQLLYGLLFVVAVFLLVLVHEFGHGLMAKQFGLRVRDVTLLPFGGVARIEKMPASPRTEAMVALAGPMTNVALAVISFPILLIWFLVRGYSSLEVFNNYQLESPSFGGFMLYTFLANLMLAVVNLVPAFPMDGGRVLRALMSSAFGREFATRAAVVTGVLFSVVIAAVALANGDLLIPLIAIFLIAAALAEGRATRLEQQIRRLQIGQFAI